MREFLREEAIFSIPSVNDILHPEIVTGAVATHRTHRPKYSFDWFNAAMYRRRDNTSEIFEYKKLLTMGWVHSYKPLCKLVVNWHPLLGWWANYAKRGIFKINLNNSR